MPKQIRSMLSIQAIPDVSAIRTAELAGDEHTVIPCIALVEGVLWPANAPHPELALAEEFGRFPQGWDGRPVVFKHPQVNGNAISASTPTVLEEALGQIFNTSIEDKKLKTEIWINEVRVAELSEELQDVVTRLKDGDEVVEVSTGLFAMQEMVTGEHNGETFESIWRNIVPDHLAILPEGTLGACSVEDGCGAPRSNQEQEFVPVMNAVQMPTECDCGGACDSCKHASTITPDPNTDDDLTQQQGIFSTLMSKFGDIFDFKSNKGKISDQDLRAAVHAALSTVEDSFWFIVAVFQNGEDGGNVVYESGFNGTLFSRNFSIEKKGVINIKGDPKQVRPVTQFVPVEVITDNSDNNGDVSDNPEINERNAQENTMDKEQFVSSLISNERTQFNEDSREWLMTLEEDQLKQLEPSEPVVENTKTPANEPAVNTDGESDGEGVDGLPNARQAQTTEEYIASAPEEIRSVLNEGLSMQKQRRDFFINALLANSRNKFTKEQLEAKPLEELENISALSNDVTYEALGAVSNASAEDDSFTPAPNPFAQEQS